MKNFKALAAGAIISAIVFVALAWVPANTDFDGAYFSTNSTYISLSGQLTNWAKNSTNLSSVYLPLSGGIITGDMAVNGTLTTGTLSTDVLAIGGQTPERLAYWHFNGVTTDLVSVATSGLVAGDGTAATAAQVTNLVGQVLSSASTPNWPGVLIHGASVETELTNKLARAGDVVTGNLAASMAVGDTTYVDMAVTARASMTNAVSGTMTFLYATNGVDLQDISKVRRFFNGSGSDQTINLPVISSGANGWRTNVYGNMAPAVTITNGTIMKLVLNCTGPTGSAALQTNVEAAIEWIK